MLALLSQTVPLDVLIEPEGHLQLLCVDPLLKGKPGPVMNVELVVRAFKESHDLFVELAD